MKRPISLTTWFKLPENGMKEYEFLSTGSACLLKTRSNLQVNPPRFLVLSCGHVLQPFKWPQYFSEEFLRFIKPEHIKYSLESRHSNGSVDRYASSLKFLDIRSLINHSSRDIGAIDGEVNEDFAESVGYHEAGSFAQKANLRPSDRLSCWGHCFEPMQDSYEGKMIPKVVGGSFFQSVMLEESLSPGKPILRNFATTDEEIELGMCGAPLFSSSNSFMGMIEGVVRTEDKNHSFESMAAFIDSTTIFEWLRKVNAL